MCNSGRKKRSDSVKEGWTKFFINSDTPNGTGDHEHYFYYYGNDNRDRLNAYDSDGAIYGNCVKTAIHVRERETGDPWWKLRSNFALLFSEFTDKSNEKSIFGSLHRSSKYFFRLKPYSG